MLIRINWKSRDVINRSWRNSLLILLVTGLTTVIYLRWLKGHFDVPELVVTVLGTAIAFFIGFINNYAYDGNGRPRWWEARSIWGELLNDSRSWSRSVLEHLNHTSPIEKAIQHRMVRRQLAFLNALAALLRQTDNTRYETYLTTEDCDRVRTSSSIPTAILRLQAADLHQLEKQGDIDGFRFQMLDQLLVAFTNSMGKAERIKNTVFPADYLYFTRLFIWVFIVLCSIILADTLGYWSWLMTWLIGFVYLMTYFSGQALMNPFDNNPTDTPISAIIRTAEINLLDDLGETNLPAPLKPINDDYLM